MLDKKNASPRSKTLKTKNASSSSDAQMGNGGELHQVAEHGAVGAGDGAKLTTSTTSEFPSV